MRAFDSATVAAVARDAGAAPRRQLWITPDRVFYRGLLGAPSVRALGAWTLYVGLDAPIRASIAGGPWVAGELVLVPPHAPHRVRCDAPEIADLLIEPESLADARLPRRARVAGILEAPRLAARLRAAIDALAADLPAFGALPAARGTAAFDARFFGRALPAARPDPRIEQVLRRLRDDPAAEAAARDCAAAVGLSFSRFLHLFKQETGVPFRALRGWKRARALLRHVTREASLTDVALDVGYADSARFSHAVRQVYGLRPRDLFAGSRGLALTTCPGARAEPGPARTR